jgi:hypothetical protein
MSTGGSWGPQAIKPNAGRTLSKGREGLRMAISIQFHQLEQLLAAHHVAVDHIDDRKLLLVQRVGAKD